MNVLVENWYRISRLFFFRLGFCLNQQLNAFVDISWHCAHLNELIKDNRSSLVMLEYIRGAKCCPKRVQIPLGRNSMLIYDIFLFMSDRNRYVMQCQLLLVKTFLPNIL